MKSKVVGNLFEKLFFSSAVRQGMGVLRIEDGCKRVGGVGPVRLVPLKQACDYVLMSNGRPAFIDTKSFGSGQTFPLANINKDQVFKINYMCGFGAYGGYVVWFRKIDKVVFFDAELLRIATEGIHWEEGLYLGPIENINLERIYET